MTACLGIVKDELAELAVNQAIKLLRLESIDFSPFAEERIRCNVVKFDRLDTFSLRFRSIFGSCSTQKSNVFFGALFVREHDD